MKTNHFRKNNLVDIVRAMVATWLYRAGSCILPVILLAFLLPLPVQALTCHDGVTAADFVVGTATGSGQYPTIQSALDAVDADGLVVAVTPGTYMGPGNDSLVFPSFDTVLCSTGGFTETIIRKQTGNYAVNSTLSFARKIVIRGFTFENFPTAIRIVNGSVVIDKNAFRENMSAVYGESVTDFAVYNSIFYHGPINAPVLQFKDSTGVRIVHSDIFENAGTGILADNSDVELKNSILWQNSGTDLAAANGGTFAAGHNIIQDGVSPLFDQGGNGISDPLFETTDQLAPDFLALEYNPDDLKSPGIDNGDPAAVTADPDGYLAADLYGVVRDAVLPVDIGARESALVRWPKKIEFKANNLTGSLQAPAGKNVTLQLFDLTAAGMEEANWNITVPSSCGWLNVDPASGTLAEGEQSAPLLTVLDNTVFRSLSNGSYPCTLTLNGSLANSGVPLRPRTLDVILQINQVLEVNPGDRIQDAIDIAANGDVVLVNPGTYTGSGNCGLDFMGLDIALVASEQAQDTPPASSSTIIDCTGIPGPAITLDMYESPEAIVNGFKIINTQTATDPAILIDGSSPTIVNCEFATLAGPAINAVDSGSRISASTFSGVTGAVRISGSSAVSIDHCSFDGTFNGAILLDSSTASINGSVFDSNSGVKGTISATNNSGLSVVNSIFSKNDATGAASGIAVDASAANILNCTFAGNQGTTAVEAVNSGTVRIRNTVFWQNSNPSFTGITTAECVHCAVDETTLCDADDVDLSGGPLPFLTPTSFRLKDGSPLIDAGVYPDPDYPDPALYTDIRGSLRPVDGNPHDAVSTAQFDIGAYEYSQYYAAPSVVDQPTSAFKDLQISGPVVDNPPIPILVDFEYEVTWADKQPFAQNDVRITGSSTYRVNLALVDDYGRRIDLLNGQEVDSTTSLHTISSIIFNQEHKGIWRLRLELSDDPNQYVLSEWLDIKFKETGIYAFGQEITPPVISPDVSSIAVPGNLVQPEITEEDYDNSTGIVYWFADENRLYAVSEGRAQVTWKWQDAAGNEYFEPTLVEVHPPADPLLFVVGSPAVDELGDTGYDTVNILYTDSDASVRNFNSLKEGWTVLLLSDSLGKQSSTTKVIRAVDWDHDPACYRILGGVATPVSGAACTTEHLYISPALLLDSTAGAIPADAYYPGTDFKLHLFSDAASCYNPSTPGNCANAPTYHLNQAGSVTVHSPGETYQYSSVYLLNREGMLVQEGGYWEADYPRETAIDIGEEAMDSRHNDICGSGYVMLQSRGKNDQLPYDADTYAATGQVFPVNLDTDPDDDLLVIWYRKDSSGICWPSYATEYTPQWPAAAPVIDIADQQGSGPLPPDTYGQQGDMFIYYQPDPALPGFNPNEEHAMFFPAGSGDPAVFALRTTLNGSPGNYPLSEPFVLLRYLDPASGKRAYLVFNVVRNDHILDRTVGQEMTPFYPLDQTVLRGDCKDSFDSGSKEFLFTDKSGRIYAEQGPVPETGTLPVRIRYHYALQEGFYVPDAAGWVVGGTPENKDLGCVSWEAPAGSPNGTPHDTEFHLLWPAEVPTLHVGETLINAKLQEGESVGLPAINGQCKVQILYDQPVETAVSAPDYEKYSVNLIDPLKEYGEKYVRINPEAELPAGLKPKYSLATGRWVFDALPWHLKMRLTWDPTAVNVTPEGDFDSFGQLKLKGYYMEGMGEPTMLLNMLTQREIDEIDALAADGGTFKGYLKSLNTLAEKEHVYPPNGFPVPASPDDIYTPYPYPFLKDAEMKALTAGDARGTGYVVLAFNNDPDCTAPTMLEVIRVRGPLYDGEIKVFESDSPFDEKLTLRHNGDFGGNSDTQWFQWKYLGNVVEGIPGGPGTSGEEWYDYSPVKATGGEMWADKDTANTTVDKFYKGAVDVTIGGEGTSAAQLLSDRWFSTRYYFNSAACGTGHPDCPEQVSNWTAPQLYEGWLKRVMKKINLFDQKFKDFHAADVNTLSSILALIGAPYEGPVPLCDDADCLQNTGLLQLYETLFDFIYGMISYDDPGLNQALLLIASRISDLYMALGNEAYGDALDPTIGFSTSDGSVFGERATSIHAFQNQTASLLEEELDLLHGRWDKGLRPFYNRLPWNFTIGDGEIAYVTNYAISDQDVDLDGDGYPDGPDGEINEKDAMVLFPQGHGDAWGHYLSAMNRYYQLLRHPDYTWSPRSEAILIGQAPVSVDFLDERKFAAAAAALARTGADIVSLTYREQFTADPQGQWQGYNDDDPDRAWGLAGWGARAGQAAYFDWVTANSLLPADDPGGEGIQRIDRTTVADLGIIASAFSDIQAELDKADAGLNPLGIARDAVPFDIDPSLVLHPNTPKTHFEQIYDRALEAMDNAVTVFDFANDASRMLRRQQDSLADFKRTIDEREADFNNRLIELAGYPYSDDCGPGKTYSTQYCTTGPDLYHFMYVDPKTAFWVDKDEIQSNPFTVSFKEYKKDGDGKYQIDNNGNLVEDTKKDVTFNVSTDSRFGLVKDKDWTGVRKAPGEIQLALSTFYQSRTRFLQLLKEHDNLVDSIAKQAELLKEKRAINAEVIKIYTDFREEAETLDHQIQNAQEAQVLLRDRAEIALDLGSAAAEAVPQGVTDAGAPARGSLKYGATLFKQGFLLAADIAAGVQSNFERLKEELEYNLAVNLARSTDFTESTLLADLERLINDEVAMRYELYLLAENMAQQAGECYALFARLERILEDQHRFRVQTAGYIQDARYKDMSFRIFRNDALQKYRAQFDLAARYVYLAAKAYDFETTLLGTDSMAGQDFLNDIVRQQTIGTISGGQPITGSGLADPLARMKANFSVLKGQLGFNNPQVETNRFSLRTGLERIKPKSAGDNDADIAWRSQLTAWRVPDLWQIDAFRRHCRPFAAEGTPEPGLVIPFSTTVSSGRNFFGRQLAGGDSYYSAANFATKIRSVGVWFSDYNMVGLAETPRVYLIPAGEDVLRPPAPVIGEIRTWKVVDQAIPVPFPIGTGVLETVPDWIPGNDTMPENFVQVRHHADFRAYHDAGYNESEMTYDSRLIGRSVWNTEWLLIIPGRNLNYNGEIGLDSFIDGPLIPGSSERSGDGVSDIKIFFQTYAYPGN